MYLTSHLLEHVFREPYRHGFRKLRILSGYASSAFLYHILDTYPDIEIDLIIGMSKRDGINRWDHERYRQVMHENPRIQISYKTTHPPVHTKIYHWYNDARQDDTLTFVGSANFSWGGFRDQKELLVVANHDNIDEVFDLPDVISCTDPDVDQHINFHNIHYRRQTQTIVANPTNRTRTEPAHVAQPMNLQNLEYIDLSLLINENRIHEKAGLNWGQRPGREPNQAYIPVPTPFTMRENPTFFPPLEQTFTMLTDDGEQLMCVMAQANRKAIHTSESNSIMGRYFRNRLGVALGARVDVQDLLNYGRTSVRIYKMDDETYFMDFGVDSPVTEVW
ncbi:NgoFVII restriction endonuclease [Mesobacillus persicus]|uniref:NgoFVII restriction endonuclease n=1 Tax=Mesobacillus persicus TaxID=930146 RepID=A0A1H7XQ37_9BACI|nr:restriction endonuclease PLD domain-containing protein [Mesobacillus persicus]SEM35851.1 NgoFVII restriction endonuclease [Mesobacillus persicus]